MGNGFVARMASVGFSAMRCSDCQAVNRHPIHARSDSGRKWPALPTRRPAARPAHPPRVLPGSRPRQTWAAGLVAGAAGAALSTSASPPQRPAYTRTPRIPPKAAAPTLPTQHPFRRTCSSSPSASWPWWPCPRYRRGWRGSLKRVPQSGATGGARPLAVGRRLRRRGRERPSPGHTCVEGRLPGPFWRRRKPTAGWAQ